MNIRSTPFVRLRHSLFVVGLAGVAGCSGGSSVLTRPMPGMPGTSPTTPPTPIASAVPTQAPTATSSASTTTDGTATVTLSLDVITGTSAKRAAASYFSAKTESVALLLTAVNGVKPATFIFNEVNVGGSGSPCTIAASAVSCTLSLPAPAGNDTFKVLTYAIPNGSKAPISIGTATATVTPGHTTNLPVNLVPVVSQVSYSIAPSASTPLATPATFTLNVTGKDSAGDVIGGSDPYYSPIVVTSKDASGHVSASPALSASLTAPGQTVTFAYDGKGTAASYIFDIAVGGDVFSGQVLPTAAALTFTSVAQHLYLTTVQPNAIEVYDIAADGTLSGPSRTIAGSATGLMQPTAIHVDTLGTIYVLNYLQNIVVFAAGSNGNVAPMETLATGQRPSVLAGNGDTGFVVAEQPNANDQSSVDVAFASIYPVGPPNGATVPSSTSGFTTPYILNSLAVSPASGQSAPAYLCGGQITTTDSTGDGSVACFPNPVVVNDSGYPTQSFTTDPDSPVGLAFRPDGMLAVSNGPAYGEPNPNVTTYHPPVAPTVGTGSTTPVYQLMGSNTGIVTPGDLAFDTLGNLYVSEEGRSSGQGAVLVFPMNATGNVAPTRSLTGFLYGPAIAVGP